MANEAFALSPISARAASPTDADFDAIREAFLETARGRWFLDEYTRRNRNADTAMVLEAVARIERTLAAQKEEQARQPESEQASVEVPSSEPPADASSDVPNPLPEAMAAVKAILATARETAAAVLDGPAIEDALAPSRKCARVIREIVWGLRESGADGRICALLDSQVLAITAACDQIAAGGLRDGVLRAFDQAAQDIEAIAPSAAEPRPEAEPAGTVHVVDFRRGPEEQPLVAAEVTLFEVTDLPEPLSPEPAPDIVPSADDEPPIEAAVTTAEANVRAEAVTTAHLEQSPGEPQAELNSGTVHQPVEDAAVKDMVPEPAVTTPEPTLGASLLASGIVAKPASTRSDRLAAILRMSHAEKIAFFS